MRGAHADSDKAKAKAHYKSGNTHFKLARFGEALASYSKAYELVPLAGLLYNIAQCHANLKNYERAAFFYEGYLREKPNASDRTAVERMLTEASSSLATEQAAEAERLAAEEEAKRLADEEAKQEAERRKAQPNFMPGSTSGTGPANDQSATPIYKKWWFWGAVGGVALAAGGGVFLAASGDTVLPSGSLGTLDGRQ